MKSTEIREMMRKLDARMMRLPVGQADAEFETLEMAYNQLAEQLIEAKRAEK